MQDFFEQNPRKTIIVGLYAAVFVLTVLVLQTHPSITFSAYAALTVILLILFRVDFVAMLGNLYYGRGKTEQAAKLFKWSVAHHTKSPATHLYYAIYLMRRGHAEEANVLLDKAYTLNPGVMALKNIQLTKASCMWLMGDVDKAIEILERMRKTFDYVNATVLSTLSYMYYLKEDYEQAEQLSLAAIEEQPNSAAAWDNLGQIYFKQNNIPQSREALLKALEYKPELADSLFWLGQIAEMENDSAQAQDYYTRAQASNITAMNTVTREQIEEAKSRLEERR